MNQHLLNRRMPIWAFLLAVLASTPVLGHSSEVGATLEHALLAERWPGVAKATAVKDALAASPVLRALRAHSLMLTNRSNESVALFLSLDDAAARPAWSRWTADLLTRHADSPVAHYLRGDALAREGDWEGARRAYAVALGAESPRTPALRHPAPAHIGIGIALAHLGDLKQAEQSLKQAIAADSKVAEAYASLGNVQLLHHAPLGAATSYKQALRLSPHYALALNGLACAQYGLGDWNSADAGFAKAAGELPLALFVGNRRALYAAAAVSPDLLNDADSGMQLTVTRGLIDQQRYKDGLTTSQIAEGQWNIDHKWRVGADLLEGSGLPSVSALGAQWNRHLDKSTLTNAKALEGRGTSLDRVAPGGASTDQSHAFVDQGRWPFTNWFGLVQSTEPPQGTLAHTGDPQ